jgi:hypothetical protein
MKPITVIFFALVGIIVLIIIRLEIKSNKKRKSMDISSIEKEKNIISEINESKNETMKLKSTEMEIPVCSESEAVEELLSIYAKNPDGFAPGYGDPRARAKVREIGEALNREGGMELMLKVHAEFQRRTKVFGAPRNLEHTWDSIGEWMG